MLLVIVQIIPGLWICLLKEFVSLFLCCCSQIRIAALNAASTAADESQDPLRSSKSQTKEAQVQPRCRWIGSIVLPPNVDLNWFFFSFFFFWSLSTGSRGICFVSQSFGSAETWQVWGVCQSLSWASQNSSAQRGKISNRILSTQNTNVVLCVWDVTPA